MSFANIDTAFLKDEVGPILAQGLADTVIACPRDPVEYLALWLLHHLQQKELQQKRREAMELEEKEREEWNRLRASKQSVAANVIQREWKHFIKSEEDRRLREKKLVEYVQDAERELEEAEEYREDGITFEEVEGMTDAERDKIMDKEKAKLQFKKAQAMIARLHKGATAEIKNAKKPSPNVVLTMKCCFYLFGQTPKKLSTWDKISTLIKPGLFLEKCSQYVPLGGGKKKRVIQRVRRILKAVNDEELRNESIAVFLLFQWMLQIIEYRERHADDVKMKKEMGRDVEEEEEEEKPKRT